jgi:translocator protein
MKNGWKLLLSLLIPQLVAAAAGYFTITGTGSWYQRIAKPSWNPPSWVFGPVWTLLYILMGISLFLVWKGAPKGPRKSKAIILWVLQLFFNFWWSVLFFGLHRIGAALIDLALLWGFILATIFAFAPFSRWAAWLLVPYISWVSFAGLLNYTIWAINR